jgi:hypothetical protein
MLMLLNCLLLKWRIQVFTQGSGGKERRWGEVSRYGRMELFMKDIGKTIRLLVLEGSSIVMEMFMLASSYSIR